MWYGATAIVSATGDDDVMLLKLREGCSLEKVKASF